MKQETGILKLKKTANVLNEIPAKNDTLGMAQYLEKRGQLEKAAIFYEKLIKSEPFRETGYNRLLMIYRKSKDYKNELRVINTGIAKFQDFHMPSAIGKHSIIINLSKKLNVLIGLTDKKGRRLQEVEPIAKWTKRKSIVLKKLGSIKKNS